MKLFRKLYIYAYKYIKIKYLGNIQDGEKEKG